MFYGSHLGKVIEQSCLYIENLYFLFGTNSAFVFILNDSPRLARMPDGVKSNNCGIGEFSDYPRSPDPPVDPPPLPPCGVV